MTRKFQLELQGILVGRNVRERRRAISRADPIERFRQHGDPDGQFRKGYVPSLGERKLFLHDEAAKTFNFVPLIEPIQCSRGSVPGQIPRDLSPLFKITMRESMYVLWRR